MAILRSFPVLLGIAELGGGRDGLRTLLPNFPQSGRCVDVKKLLFLKFHKD
jgi:hypothetical protein